jgi:protein-S-isoprenylcysteine O-methyltransferase Ste14
VSDNKPSNALLKMYAQVVVTMGVLLAIQLLAAGTLDYWQAWVLVAMLTIAALGAFTFLFRGQSDLLERRTRRQEKESGSRRLQLLAAPLFLAVLLLPGLDRRFGWSHVPAALVIAADALVLLGYAVILWVMRENRFLSGIVEVAQGQRVISSGPYAVVRHPMYVGGLLLLCFAPLARGSYPAAILMTLVVVPALVMRISNEERLLVNDLAGYREYMAKTRFRMIPGVW